MKVNEIFYSVQGESTFTGLPTVFVRTTGCPLRCSWCDTSYAFYEGTEKSIDRVIEEIEKFGCRLVELTGGEPLTQNDSGRLMTSLLDRGFEVLLETSGAISIKEVDQRVKIIMDVKCPGSGMSGRMDWGNLSLLKPGDEIKFVIAGREDYEWSRETVIKLKPAQTVLFSPVFGQLNPRMLVEWILDDRLPVRFQTQLHKIIWSPETRGV
ncbi:MAG TPA: radical SAM protein [Nitrospiria bacterium]|nr:radical SAM protein [Nitrospiria bacterium]